MNKSLKPNEQSKAFSKNKKLPFYQLQNVEKDKITAIKQDFLKNEYEPISQIFKFEVNGSIPQKGHNLRISESSAFKPYKKGQQEQQFVEDHQNLNKKPLKIDYHNPINKRFLIFYKDLKNNSSFPRKIPLNTIVIARSQDFILCPAIIVNVQYSKAAAKLGNFIYKVNFIDSNKIFQLHKYYLIEFNPGNIAKIKQFFDSKKLNKAFKIAEKMFNQQRFEKNKVFKAKIVKNIIIRKQFSLSKPIKLQKDQKLKQMNLVIETLRVKPQKLTLQQESQPESNDQVLNNVENESLQQLIYHDKTYYNQQEDQTNEQYVQSFLYDSKDLIKNETKSKRSELPKLSEQIKSEKKQLKEIMKYLSKYKNKHLKNKQIKTKKSSIQKVINYLARPLSDFQNIKYSTYACMIDKLIQICLLNSQDRKERNKQFISLIHQRLFALYHILKDYEGDNTFINGVKMLQLCKLKVFQKQIQTNIKIQD